MKNKFEALIEAIINENEEAAQSLFHQIVVEKSRDIYESLMDEDEFGGNPSDDMIGDVSDEVDQDEVGFDDELSMDDADGDEFSFGDEEGAEGDLESKIDDLEAQLAELRAMLEDGEGSGSGDDEMDFDTEDDLDMGSDDESDFDADEEHVEESFEFTKLGKSGSGKSGSGKSGSGMSGSGKSGSGVKESRRKSDLEIMREYVDKIGEIYKQEPASGEGKTVGTGGDAPTVNKDSIVGPGADFGGSAKNIANGGANKNPDGTGVNKGESNAYKKGEGKLPGADKFKNTPGGSKSLEKTGKPYEKSKDAEGKGAGATGSVSVNKKSEIGGKIR